MSSAPAPVEVAEPCWEGIYAPPVALPGATISNLYSINRPLSAVVGSRWSQVSQIQYQISSPALYSRLDQSFIALNLQLIQFVAGTAFATDALVAPQFAASWARLATLILGSTTVESSSNLLGRSTYIDQMTKQSYAHIIANGGLELTDVFPPAVIPNAVAAYPPTNSGMTSTDIRPVLITSVETPALTVAIGGAVTGSPSVVQANVTIASTAAVNPDFNQSFYNRQQLTQGGARFLTVIIPLQKLFSFISKDMFPVYGNSIQITFLPSDYRSVIFRAAGAPDDGDFVIKDATLWLKTVKPSLTVAQRLYAAAAGQAMTDYQFLKRDTIGFQSQTTNTFSQTFQLPASNPQALVWSWLPQSYQLSQQGAPSSSIPPYPVTDGSFPWNTFYISYNGESIPQTPLGSVASDWARAYTYLLDATNEGDYHGAGNALTFSQFQQNHCLIVTPVGNRSVDEAGRGSSQGATITAQFVLNGTPTGGGYSVFCTYYCVQSCRIKAQAQGIEVLNVQ
jgi:hypothetical protein